MTSWAAHARVEQAPVAPPQRRRPPQQRPKPRPRAKQQHRVAGGVVWIAVFGLLLVGVVALNVAVLRENVRLTHLTHQRSDLRSSNADLAAKLSTQLSPLRVQTAARQLGYAPALPGDTSYLNLPAK
jgi:hypothetical protein